MPGGAIEFGETPEETLKRELMEEAALEGNKLKLLRIATNFGEYCNHGGRYEVHHIGIVYKVNNIKLLPNAIPEEECLWVLLENVKKEELTPFAKQIYENQIF